VEVIECPKCGEKFEPNSKYWVTRRKLELEGIGASILSLLSGLVLGWLIFS